MEMDAEDVTNKYEAVCLLLSLGLLMSFEILAGLNLVALGSRLH